MLGRAGPCRHAPEAWLWHRRGDPRPPEPSDEDLRTDGGETGATRRQLESILERVDQIIYIKDRDGRYQFINAAGERLFDRPREEILGRRDVDLFGPDEAEEISAIDEAVMREGEARRYESTRPVDGEPRAFQNDKYPYAPDGEVIGVIGVSRDITEKRERQRVLEQLHESSRELMTATDAEAVATIASETTTQILDLPFNGVHLYDPDRDALVPVAWSFDAESILDAQPPVIEADDGVAWEVYRRGEPEGFADVREHPAVLNDETPVRSELLLPLGEHGIMLIASPAVDDFDQADTALSRVLAANVEAALDRVEREEELERRNQRLDDFAGIVSHDLRNPLTVASGRLQMARSADDSEHLEAVAEALDRMDALIDDVLTWARQDRTLAEREPVSLEALATACWEGLQTDAAELTVVDDLVVEADRERLRRVMENLLRNAVEHAGPAVAIRVGTLGEGTGFYVEDDGPGIPPTDREAIFETGGDGSGFGLAIVREIVEAHGWSIAATEGEAGGARLEVRGVTRGPS